MSKTASEYLVEALEKTGVKRIYGVMGDSLNDITDALRRRKSIDWIHMRHEAATAFAAAPKSILPETSPYARGRPPTETLSDMEWPASGAKRSSNVQSMLLTPAQKPYNSRAIGLAWSGASSPTNPETDAPSSLTAFSRGNAILNKSTATDSRSLRLSTEPGIVRLRVTNSKSANFTLSVTVRPRVPLSSQCRQTLSISVCDPKKQTQPPA